MKRQHPGSAYLEAGLDLLERDGYGGLKLASLCAELGVTSGAFYHNFANWSAYKSALIEHWKNDQTTALIAVIEAESDPVEQLETLLAFTMGLRHRAESASRAWSNIDADVARVQEAVDEARIEAARAVISQYHPSPVAEGLARAAYQSLVGFQVLDRSSDASVLRSSLERIVREVLATTFTLAE